MAISMYQASIPVFVQFLNSLSAILKKGADYAAAKKFDPAILVNTRLAPDMFALARQIQIATDHAKGAAARLTGSEVPSYPDTETSIEALQARIAKTIEFVKSFKPEQFEGSDERKITLRVGGEDRTFVGCDYLFHFALPNFYFHTTTAYAILRHNGVDIGKRDFVGVLKTV
ncbi:MAG: DUF1993 family protein [Alphaproteobacteria bacterium]|nr:DUF1993 family protein [Alphaproteobacteria bacterium]